MSENSIRDRALTGTIWKFLERMMAQGISLIVSIIIARILTPDEYSVVSIVVIFFAFADVFISGGFNTALMQKKDADIEDYSSVLILSLGISFALYALLFFVSPFIARLYNKPILISVFRIMSLVLPVNALKSILCAYISSKLEFRKFFIATSGGTIVSGIVGIYLAKNGYGPWALVAQQMTNSIIDTIILFFSTRIRFIFSFSFRKIKGLFSYGWKVFATSILITIYTYISPLVIGLKFSAESLSYYTKGQSFPSLISSTCTNTLSAVLFPVMAKYQDDKGKLLRYTRRFIGLSSFLIFPAMLGMFAVANNFVELILTEKWLPIVPFIRIFCVAYMFDVIHVGNCETIKAMGRSDIYLKMEIIKKTSYFIIIGIFVLFSDSPIIMSLSAILCAIVAIVVNSIPNVRLINYSISLQLHDMIQNLTSAVIMAICVILTDSIEVSCIYRLILQIIIGAFVYLLLAVVMRNSNLKYLIQIIKSKTTRLAHEKRRL